jgi:hypothetical protein
MADRIARHTLRLKHRHGMDTRSQVSSAGKGSIRLLKFKFAVRISLSVLLTATAMVAAAARPAICDDASAQFGHRVIRHVRITRHNVFSEAEQRKGLLADDPWIDRFPLGAQIRWLNGPDGLDIIGWANWIHIKTRENVIDRELLFHSGEVEDPAVLAETERNLRGIGLFRNATIASNADEKDPGAADVDVVTEDAWTLQPKVSLAFLGGSHVTGGAGIAEYNLFGLGKAAEVFRGTELYRRLDILGYNDPRVFGTHWHLLATGTEDSDGRIRSLLLEYPFYSLQVPFSLTLAPSYIVDRERLFADRVQQPITFRRIQTTMAAEGDLALVATHDLVRRVGLRYQEWDDTFTSVQNYPPTSKLGLEDRRTHALEATYTEWWPHFIKTYFLDQLGHPEDKDLGFAYGLRIGYSPEAIGASTNELVLGSSLSLGGQVSADTYSWLYLQTAGRERAGHLADSFVTAEGIVYQRLPAILDHPQTFVADARGDLSSGLFRDHEFVAGGDGGGLRGYPVNFIGGSRRLMIHLEDRVTIAQDLFHLMSIGAVGFFDGGEVWGRGRSLEASNFLASVGVGLRIAGTRGTLQIPVRIDFGIPLVHHVGVNAVDVGTGSGDAFGTFGQPFYAQDNSVSVPENFAPDQTVSPYHFTSPFTNLGGSFPNY